MVANTYFIQSIVRALEDDVPLEHVVIVLEADRHIEVVVLLKL